MIEFSPELRPVIVEVLKSELESGKTLAVEAATICAVVSRILGRRTENVHVIYEPAARGRVAFGGQLVR